MISWWRSLGPATLRPAPQEMIRSSVGAALGLFLADLILWALTGTGPMMTQTLLIGPFGATAFLIFAVPTSPLAQPWQTSWFNRSSKWRCNLKWKSYRNIRYAGYWFLLF